MVPSNRHYLEDKAGQHLITFQDGVKAAPSTVFSQFKVEIVTIDQDHVGFINSAGFYLTALSDKVEWFVKTPDNHERFRPETHGEWQAFKSHDGNYLNINSEGYLDIVSTDSVEDSQLFARQGFSGEFESDKLIATLPSWGPAFRISFDMLIRSVDKADWGTAFLFASSGEDNRKLGDRSPGLWTNRDGRLHVFSQVGTNPNLHQAVPITLGTWHRVQVEQWQNSQGEVVYKII